MLWRSSLDITTRSVSTQLFFKNEAPTHSKGGYAVDPSGIHHITMQSPLTNGKSHGYSLGWAREKACRRSGWARNSMCEYAFVRAGSTGHE